MREMILNHQALSDVGDSMLIVIDVQQSFIEKMSTEHIQPIINRIS